MDVNTFYNYLENPGLLNRNSLDELFQIKERYPYFQLAGMLILKNLRMTNDYRYEEELKKVSAFFPDRAVLYDYINNFEKITPNQNSDEPTVTVTGSVTIPDKPLQEEGEPEKVLTSLQPDSEHVNYNDAGSLKKDSSTGYPQETVQSPEYEEVPEVNAPVQFSNDTEKAAISSLEEDKSREETNKKALTENIVSTEKPQETTIQSICYDKTELTAREIQEPVKESIADIILRKAAEMRRKKSEKLQQEVKAEEVNEIEEPESVTEKITEISVPDTEAEPPVSVQPEEEVPIELNQESQQEINVSDIESVKVDEPEIKEEISVETESTVPEMIVSAEVLLEEFKAEENISPDSGGDFIQSEINTVEQIPEVKQEEENNVSETGLIEADEKQLFFAPVLDVSYLLKEESEKAQCEEPENISELSMTFLEWMDFMSVKRNKVSKVTEKDNLVEGFLSRGSTKSPSDARLEIAEVDTDFEFTAEEELISEQLAEILGKQGYYKKAISMYGKLALKYPEKSIYFAGLIQGLKNNIVD